MYAMGKIDPLSYSFASSPFHPFGGAVDIIVVQQEDGTFKSSPWHVKFGKFQGVFKQREKKVVVGVNDSDADFHMYLDHKGEAYFLKDAQGEGEVATFSSPEATSASDENSSHMLALEYPRVEEGANPISEQLGNKESEDDLELRFEGRGALKQLIQKSVEERATAAAAGVGGKEMIIPQENYSGGVDIEIRESPRAEEGFSSDQKSPGSQSEVEVGRKTESSNAKIMHALLNNLQGSSGVNLPVRNIASKDAQAVELAYEQAIIPEEVSKLVSVHVDKALVENLEGALTPKIAGDSQVTSGMVKDITTPGKEVAILSSGNAKDVRSPEVPTPGQELPVDSSREVPLTTSEDVLDTQEYLRMAGNYMRPRKVWTNSPSSPQLASLDLKEGSNKITFTFETRVFGKQQVDARIYLWKWNTRIVISTVDGTITKSDVLGQIMPLMGKDGTQIGVARLFSAIKKNGYELMFLSARAIFQAYLTRQFLENSKQDGEALPDGPVVISPDGLFPSLYREVKRRAPHEFMIACLEDIKSLFPPESKPFYAGFGNRNRDEFSYLKVGIPKGRIFTINRKGEVVVNNQVDVKSYTLLHKLVDDLFPVMSVTEQEDYDEWNFWKMPLPERDDEPSVKSSGISSSSKSNSGRLAMARSREDVEKRIILHQEDAGKSKLWAQEGSKIMDEDHYAMKGKFAAEEDAKKHNATEKDCEGNSVVGTQHNYLGPGKQKDFGRDFIREINRGDSGYFVSKAWLFSLEEHDKETVMSVLRRAGYFEFHQTRTMIIYRRIISDVLDSEMATVSSFENKVPMVQIDETSHLGSQSSLPDKRKTVLSSSNEMLQSFKTDLKDIRLDGYFVSTPWLSTLSDHEVEDLNIVLGKAGYSQIAKTSTTTVFKRHDHVHNNPGSRSETPSAVERNTLGYRRKSSTHQGTEVFVPEKLQDFDINDTEVTTEIQARQTRLENCECHIQRLTVSCTPPFQSPVEASTSSPQAPKKNSERQPVGDCHVTMSKTRKQRIANTTVDKKIEMSTVDFNDEGKYVKTVSLVLSAETSVSCCLTTDPNDRKVRFKFLKIQGAVKTEESMTLEHIELVLRALRTNVYADITDAEESEGPEFLDLCILNDSGRPWVRELERYPSIDGTGQTRRLVWMEISAKDPNNSEPGSKTLELQCFDNFCTDFDLKFRYHELLFGGGPPVVFEGDIYEDLAPNSFLEFDVRYQLEICYNEACDPLRGDDHFVGFNRETKKVDFDCVLEFNCRVP